MSSDRSIEHEIRSSTSARDISHMEVHQALINFGMVPLRPGLFVEHDQLAVTGAGLAAGAVQQGRKRRDGNCFSTGSSSGLPAVS
jgi:hypothetical protein